MKLKYPNQILAAYAKPAKIPAVDELQYTQVLTKQSALFNSWKEMNRVANESTIPFRCVTQWATYQTGKVYDTLGLSIGQTPIQAELFAGGSGARGAGQNPAKSGGARKKAVRDKK